METKAIPCHKRLKTHQDGSLCIPDDLLDNIFSYLPIKDAVKIGILSTRFKKSWHNSRKLNFDRSFAEGLSRVDFISIVNKVFDLHSGSIIESFTVCFDPTDEVPLVDKWVKEASTKGVKELDLDFCPARMNTGEPSLSADLFDIRSLRILKLSYCNIIKLPPRFKGLAFLSIVALRLVNVTSELLHALFSTCLFLETLDLAHCTGYFRISAGHLKSFKVLKIGDCFHNYSSIEVEAPTLRSFHYCGPVQILKLGDVSQLNDVLLNFRPSAGFTVPFQVFDIVNQISGVQILSSSCTILEGLSPRILGGKWSEMNYSFHNLKELQLSMEGASYCNPLDIVLFVKNCPSLSTLLIDLEEFSFDCGAYWDFHHRQLLEGIDLCFPSLKLIKLSGFKFQQYEIKLATIFLNKAINLEKLILITAKPGRTNVIPQENPDNYKQFFIACQESILLKIEVLEHFNDTSGLYPFHCKTWYNCNSFQ